ncbi:unnamed protein product [Urochloa decumbens]|uniref:Transcription repressor n=1 Tax=Urochloa decumbens TaxID=240449 RepID=A0ABC8ZI60_9POAL
MGRHKFRLSDMIPNAWFFKLRDMRARAGAAAAPSPRVAAASRPLPSTPRQGAWLPHRASHYYTPRAGDILLGSPSPLHHPKASDTRFPPLQLSPPRRSSRRRHHHRRRSFKLAAAPPSSSVTSSTSSGVASSSPASAGGCRCGRGRRSELLVVEAPDTPPCRRDMFVGGGYSSDDSDGGGDEDMKKPAVAARPRGGKLDGKVFTSATEIIIDLRSKRRPETKTLPPIMTTRAARREQPDGGGCEPDAEDKHIDVLKHATRRAPLPAPEQSKLKPRRSVSSARRLKTRANTPRLASPRKCKPPPAITAPLSPARTKPPPAMTAAGRTKPAAPPLAESFAVVKSSRDPRRDFRESMEEMIAENGIRSAADLEDLLACYLALNAAEYHDLIVEVFEHIWLTLSDVKV